MFSHISSLLSPSARCCSCDFATTNMNSLKSHMRRHPQEHQAVQLLEQYRWEISNTHPLHREGWWEWPLVRWGENKELYLAKTSWVYQSLCGSEPVCDYMCALSWCQEPGDMRNGLLIARLVVGGWRKWRGVNTQSSSKMLNICNPKWATDCWLLLHWMLVLY